jgi:hypothetical protein
VLLAEVIAYKLYEVIHIAAHDSAEMVGGQL